MIQDACQSTCLEMQWSGFPSGFHRFSLVVFCTCQQAMQCAMIATKADCFDLAVASIYTSLIQNPCVSNFACHFKTSFEFLRCWLRWVSSTAAMFVIEIWNLRTSCYCIAARSVRTSSRPLEEKNKGVRLVLWMQLWCVFASLVRIRARDGVSKSVQVDRNQKCWHVWPDGWMQGWSRRSGQNIGRSRSVRLQPLLL